MIGFSEQPITDKGRPNEDPETRDLDKRKLYNLLAIRNFLPPLSTKGVTREYLIKVYKGEVYTVLIFDLKHFEVELSTSMLKRVGIPNNSLLVRKLNGLLASRDLPPLGFDDFEPPDEVRLHNKNWLYRVARFVDVNNILQFFETPVVQGDPKDAGANIVHRTHYGRLKASKFFHRIPEARKDRKFWESLHTISMTYKNYLCQKLIIEKLNSDIEAAVTKRTELEKALDNLISQAACTYTTFEQPAIRAEHIIHGNQNVSQEIRDLVMMNCRL